MVKEIITYVISALAIGSAVYCILNGTHYYKARKRFERITGEYLSVVNRDVQDGTAASLADPLVMCGGCGGYMLASENALCPGAEKCQRYAEVLAEHHQS